MKKITDLVEERDYFKTERDSDGNRTREPYTALIKRPVQTVSGGARFGHYLLDVIVLYAINFVLGIVLGIVNPEAVLGIPDIVWNLVSMLLLVTYYFVMESSIQTTVGKLATNSVVIDEYGNKPNNSALIGRSFARLIPFEAFSCLGTRGWHDTLSKTYVVTKKEQAILKRLMQEQAGMIHIDERTDILD